MPERRDILLLLGVGIAAATAGVLFGPRIAGTLNPSELGVLRAADLIDLEGRPRRIAEWNAKILVCNFWATWCEPCREEIPAFVRVRDKYLRSGIEFVGIAIDRANKVAEFARDQRISYPLLLAGESGFELIRKLGNPGGGLPFTLVIYRNSHIVHRKLGVFTEHQIDALLAAVLAVPSG